jgi:hypothetical protein
MVDLVDIIIVVVNIPYGACLGLRCFMFHYVSLFRLRAAALHFRESLAVQPITKR